MRFPALLSLVVLSTLGAVTMHADTFTFSFGTSSDPIAGSGVLTGTMTGVGEYTITGIEGTTRYPGYAALNITGVLPTGSFEGNNNLLSLTNSGYIFDTNGLSYELSNQTEINLYTDPSLGGAANFQTTSNVIGSEYASYAVVPTPEPASLVLLGTGLLSALGVGRRRLLASVR